MRLRMMVVNGEPAVLKLIKSLVERLGCEVVALGDSRETEQRLRTDKFDGIPLDYNMPHLDGFVLAQELRSSSANSRTPVVMLTGDDDAGTVQKAFRTGITFLLDNEMSRHPLSRI